MWILEAIIEEIYDAYERLPGGRVPLPRTDEPGGKNGKPRIPIGSREKARNQDYRVIWLLQNGNFGSPTLAASAPPPDPNPLPDGAVAGPPEQPTPHYQALARFWIWIWDKDQEACWNIMVDLLAAMRATVYGPNLGPQNFQYPTELDGKNLQDGSLCVVDVVISVPIPRDGTVAVESTIVASIEGGVRTRGDLLGLETEPEPAPDFDLVIVTNDETTAQDD